MLMEGHWLIAHQLTPAEDGMMSSLFAAFMFVQPGTSLVFIVQKKFSSFSELLLTKNEIKSKYHENTQKKCINDTIY